MAMSSQATMQAREREIKHESQPAKGNKDGNSRMCRIEDKLDYSTVRHARTLASKRGEKSMAWSDFKKTLGE